MKRLTSNKAVSEMNVIELAHNSCYAKDHEARYRDYDTDIDAREQAIKLLDKFAGVPNEFTCDEDFEDFMADYLQYGTDDILGLIAVFYKNVWAMANLRERLKEYEDLEEQGKLLIMAYEICVVSECNHCNHTERRIEETWIRPELLSHNGFYKTKESAEAALKEMSE